MVAHFMPAYLVDRLNIGEETINEDNEITGLVHDDAYMWLYVGTGFHHAQAVAAAEVWLFQLQAGP